MYPALGDIYDFSNPWYGSFSSGRLGDIHRSDDVGYVWIDDCGEGAQMHQDASILQEMGVADYTSHAAGVPSYLPVRTSLNQGFFFVLTIC